MFSFLSDPLCVEVVQIKQQVLIATCGSRYAFHLGRHPLPAFELGTPTTNPERTHALDRLSMAPLI